MAESALSACMTLATQIYAIAQQARSNREDCATMASMVARVEPLLAEVRAAAPGTLSGAATGVVEGLRDCMQRMRALLMRAGGMGPVRAFINAGDIRDRFATLGTEFSAALSHLGLVSVSLSQALREDLRAHAASLEAAFRAPLPEAELAAVMRDAADAERRGGAAAPAEGLAPLLRRVLATVGYGAQGVGPSALAAEAEALAIEARAARARKDAAEEHFIAQIIAALSDLAPQDAPGPSARSPRLRAFAAPSSSPRQHVTSAPPPAYPGSASGSPRPAVTPSSSSPRSPGQHVAASPLSPGALRPGRGSPGGEAATSARSPRQQPATACSPRQQPAGKAGTASPFVSARQTTSLVARTMSGNSHEVSAGSSPFERVEGSPREGLAFASSRLAGRETRTVIVCEPSRSGHGSEEGADGQAHARSLLRARTRSRNLGGNEAGDERAHRHTIMYNRGSGRSSARSSTEDEEAEWSRSGGEAERPRSGGRADGRASADGGGRSLRRERARTSAGDEGDERAQGHPLRRSRTSTGGAEDERTHQAGGQGSGPPAPRGQHPPPELGEGPWGGGWGEGRGREWKGPDGMGSADDEPPPPEYLCPISGQLMAEPVILVESGKTYERAAIVRWLAAGHARCPASGVTLASMQMVPNIDFAAAIAGWAEQRGLQRAARRASTPAGARIEALLARIADRTASPSATSLRRPSGASHVEAPGVAAPIATAAGGLGATVGLEPQSRQQRTTQPAGSPSPSSSLRRGQQAGEGGTPGPATPSASRLQVMRGASRAARGGSSLMGTLEEEQKPGPSPHALPTHAEMLEGSAADLDEVALPELPPPALSRATALRLPAPTTSDRDRSGLHTNVTPSHAGADATLRVAAHDDPQVRAYGADDDERRATREAWRTDDGGEVGGWGGELARADGDLGEVQCASRISDGLVLEALDVSDLPEISFTSASGKRHVMGTGLDRKWQPAIDPGAQTRAE